VRERVIARLYASNSWPNGIGTASWRCVRPTFLIDLNCEALVASDFSSFLASVSSAGSWRRIATFVVEGFTSFDDWPRFT